MWNIGIDCIDATNVALIVISFLLLRLTLGLMGIITPFAIGPSPLYYGSSYLPSKNYRRVGAIFPAVFLAIGVPRMIAIKRPFIPVMVRCSMPGAALALSDQVRGFAVARMDCASFQLCMREFLSRLKPPWWLVMTACISASIDRATSTGLSEPRSRPTGA